MPTTRVTFPGATAELAAHLHTPPGRPRATAIFAHCFTCSKDLKSAVKMGAALEARGIAVLRFDFTGLGQSEGDFADSTFSTDVSDLIAAARFLEETIAAPSLLVGHSLGGAVVLSAASHLPSIKAIATIGAPAEASHVEKLFAKNSAELAEHGEARIDIGGRPFHIKQSFVDDLRAQSILECVADLKTALLVCHAPLDEIVSVDNATKLFVAAKHPKSFLSLDSADHLLRREDDALYAAECIATWAERFLPELEPVGDSDERHIVVTTGATGFATDVVAGPHRLRADEPLAFGGTETGPTPYGYLLAALGTCTSMTLRMYADRKKLDLAQVTVRLSHDKVHASDCADCETESGKIDVIEREIALEGDLTAQQRQRLLEIADKCPVHKTLHAEIRVRSRLV